MGDLRCKAKMRAAGCEPVREGARRRRGVLSGNGQRHTEREAEARDEINTRTQRTTLCSGWTDHDAHELLRRPSLFQSFIISLPGRHSLSRSHPPLVPDSTALLRIHRLIFPFRHTCSYTTAIIMDAANMLFSARHYSQSSMFHDRTHPSSPSAVRQKPYYSPNYLYAHAYSDVAAESDPTYDYLQATHSPLYDHHLSATRLSHAQHHYALVQPPARDVYGSSGYSPPAVSDSIFDSTSPSYQSATQLHDPGNHHQQYAPVSISMPASSPGWHPASDRTQAMLSSHSSLSVIESPLHMHQQAIGGIKSPTLYAAQTQQQALQNYLTMSPDQQRQVHTASPLQHTVQVKQEPIYGSPYLSASAPVSNGMSGLNYSYDTDFASDPGM
ncbi:hypothetical protein OE88DRAFT_73330 [Heliocybe sulcata]|uniref:Uncharacterized protein n=1 Tax=Heliocybe sulcata TaxID=5364 RepID=A0A5C3NJ56_9AGAM|nr:hypothetical protein OE88DRAFT_73330 [Heliocybe sulcata]